MYNIASLENGIESCKKNIKTFEEAIQKEYNTINEYRSMINDIKRKEQQKSESVTELKVGE